MIGVGLQLRQEPEGVCNSVTSALHSCLQRPSIRIHTHKLHSSLSQWFTMDAI